MDFRILRPEKFDANPNSSEAAKEWKHWLKTFENFLSVSNATTEPQKLQVLHNFISATIFDYISECADYKAAIEKLGKLFVKPKNEIFARHLLATRKQQVGETIDEFLQNLRILSKDCEFKAVSAEDHRNEAIRNAFICGLNSNHIRQRLLEHDTLTLAKACDNARSLEAAQRNSEQYTMNHSVNAVSTEIGKQGDAVQVALAPNNAVQVAAVSKQTCFFCGNSRHPRKLCPARDVECFKCTKVGHFGKVCTSNSKTKTPTKAAAMNTTNLNLPSIAVVSNLGQNRSKVRCSILVSDVPADALLDTGSTDSFISQSFAKNNGFLIHAGSGTVELAQNNCKSNIEGYCIENILMKSEVYPKFKFLVLPNLVTDVILGEDFQNLHDSIFIKYEGKKPQLKLCSMTPLNVDVPSLFEHLSPDCKPVSIKSRKYSSEDLQFIHSEIEKLLENGIIEPSNSPWRAQVLVSRSSTHKTRLVIDYSQTINKYTQLDAYPLPRMSDIVNNVAKYSIYSTLDLRSAYHQVKLADSDKPYTGFEALGQLYQFRRMPFGLTNAVPCFQRIINDLILKNKCEGTFAYLDDITVCGNTQAEHDTNLSNFLKAAEGANLSFNEDKCSFSVSKLTLLGYEIQKGVLKPDPQRVVALEKLPLPNNKKELQRILGLFAYYAQWIQRYSEKIRPLVQSKAFPLEADAIRAFSELKKELVAAALQPIDENLPFTVETDASDFAISATLNQNNRPVAFHARTLRTNEMSHHSVEKEAYAVIDAVRKWSHLLLGKTFTLVTDQRSVAFMYDSKKHGKIKNDKILRWRTELSQYKFDIVYRPGSQNCAPDALSRAFCRSINGDLLRKLHVDLCHPGITRMAHFVRTKNLPYSIDDVKRVTSQCKECSMVKPQFVRKNDSVLIKSTQPFERLNVDFKGPIPSSKKYMLTIVDEYTRFPFAFACADQTAQTIIHCFIQIFMIFGMPAFIHSDQGSSFLSQELRDFLHSRGVATSNTTPYNPRGNGQCEKFNATIWKSVQLALNSKGIDVSQWYVVLPEVLHSIRSLLCTSTGCTPHERLFNYARRSTNGTSIPSWLINPGKVLLRKHAKSSKYDPSVQEVDLVDANPSYATVQFADGRKSTVNIRDLAPLGTSEGRPDEPESISVPVNVPEENHPVEMEPGMVEPPIEEAPPPQHLRRSERARRPPDRLTY